MLLCVPIVLAPLGKTFEEEVKELKLRAAKLKLLLAVVVVPARMRLRASSLTATKALRVVIVKSLSSLVVVRRSSLFLVCRSSFVVVRRSKMVTTFLPDLPKMVPVGPRGSPTLREQEDQRRETPHSKHVLERVPNWISICSKRSPT